MTSPTGDHDTVRKLAVDAFNYTWTLMDLGDERTTAQDFEMIHCAHASRHLWSFVGEPVNLARGEWQVSRVYAVLARAEPSLIHAKRCLAILEEEGIGGWDIAFAHEAVARAFAVGGNIDAARKHVAEARRLAAAIDDEEDREAVLADLATIDVGR